SCPATEPTTPPTAGSGQSTTYLGATITYFNSAGLPTEVTSPLGYTTETAYTSTGLPWCTVDADQYSVVGKSCPGTPPSGPPTGIAEGYTTTLYDSAGDVTSTTTPTGATTTDTYTNP